MTAPYLVVLVINAKPLPEVSEHHGAILLELEAAGEVFPGESRHTLCELPLLSLSDTGALQSGGPKRFRKQVSKSAFSTNTVGDSGWVELYTSSL